MKIKELDENKSPESKWKKRILELALVTDNQWWELHAQVEHEYPFAIKYGSY